MANQPSSGQPNFDFQNFASQLEKTIAKALKDVFKKIDTSDLGSRIKSSIDDVDLDEMLNTQGSITSTRKLKDSIKQLQQVQRDGGIDASNRLKEEGMLRAFWEKNGLKLSDENFAKQIKNYRKQEDLLKTTKEQLKITKQINDIQKDYEKTTSKLSSKTKELMMNIKGALGSPQAMAGAATMALEKIGENFSQAFKQMKSEGLSTTQAISEYFNSLKDGAILFGKEVREAQKGFRETGGTLSEAREFGKEAAQAAAKYGGSMEQAGKALGTFQKLPGLSKEAAIAANDFSGALAQAADVPADVVMKEVANNSEAVAISGAKNLGNLQKAVVNSAKMGVEFNKIVSASRGLLDFESSINAQMEASVLLGREVNLDKAREAALQGDYLTVQREILKNVGSEAEFNKMNALQKEALAKSMGVSVSDMSKMVKGQADQTDLAKEAAAAKGEEATRMDQLKNFALENAGALAASIPSMILQTAQLLTQLSIMKSMKVMAGTGGSVAGKGGFMNKIKGMFGFGAPGAAATPPTQIPPTPAGSSKIGAPAGGGGMKGLASGLKSMAGSNVKKGIGNLALFGIAAIPAVAGIPFMIAVGLGGVRAGIGLTGLAQGLKGSGMGAAAIIKGIGNLTLFGLASIVAVAGIPFMIAVALTGYFAGKGMSGLATGLEAMAKVDIKGILMLGLLGAALIPAAIAFSLLKGVDVGSIIAFSIALPLLGLAAAGLGFIAPFIAAGAIGLAALGVGMIAVAGGLMVLQAAQGGVEVFQSLIQNLAPMAKDLVVLGAGMILLGAGVLALGVAFLYAFPGLMLGAMAMTILAIPIVAIGGALQYIATSAAGLTMVGAAMQSIGSGLGVMAVNGLAAMPVIGALIGLAAVAPALSKLGDVLGGGGSGAEQDKMAVVAEKLDTLISIVSKPAAVTLDGRKVGDAIRLNINGTAIR